MSALDYQKMYKASEAERAQAVESLNKVRGAAQTIQRLRHVPSQSLFRRYAEAIEAECDTGLGHPK